LLLNLWQIKATPTNYLSNYVLKLFHFFINTNIFISLAAVSLTLETQVQLGMKPQFHPYLFLIFFATIFDYNLHRLITVITNKEALNSDKHKWVKQNMLLFYLLVATSVVGFMWTVLLADKKVLFTLAPIAALTLFYSLPIFKNKKSIFRLREIPCLKIFLISFVWSASTILLPIIQSGKIHNKENIIAMLVERFLFVFAITIPFDIRDMKTDAKQGLKTIPLLIGKQRALIVSNIVLLLFTIVCRLHYKHTSLTWLNDAFLLSAVSTFFFINNKKLQSKELYHYGILDGTMLLQGLLVMMFYYLQTIIH
jgi:4-hydroxybenzoate polyprenyltransferase